MPRIPFPSQTWLSQRSQDRIRRSTRNVGRICLNKNALDHAILDNRDEALGAGISQQSGGIEAESQRVDELA